MYQKIESLEQLRELASKESGCDCFISLIGGLRSSKNVFFDSDEKMWYINHEIDDSYDEGLTDEQLDTQTNIVDALNVGALYLYDF